MKKLRREVESVLRKIDQLKRSVANWRSDRSNDEAWRLGLQVQDILGALTLVERNLADIQRSVEDQSQSEPQLSLDFGQARNSLASISSQIDTLEDKLKQPAPDETEVERLKQELNQLIADVEDRFIQLQTEINLLSTARTTDVVVPSTYTVAEEVIYFFVALLAGIVVNAVAASLDGEWFDIPDAIWAITVFVIVFLALNIWYWTDAEQNTLG